MEKYDHDANPMLPEVQAYLEAAEAYKNECNRSDGTEADYNRTRMARRAAWEAIGESDNPMARWIHANVAPDYRGQAELALRALHPEITIQELDAIAQRYSWCRVWGRYRQMAIRDGVIGSGVEYQMKVNGYPWQEFYPIYTNDDQQITKDILDKIFTIEGVSLVQISVDHSHIMYQVTPSS